MRRFLEMVDVERFNNGAFLATRAIQVLIDALHLQNRSNRYALFFRTVAFP